MTATATHIHKLALTLLLALIPVSLHAQPKIFFANTYGAKPDSTTLSTTAIQKAIDAAAAANGTATLKPGIYLTGRHGARIEDIVAVTAEGVERLDTVSRELVVLG